MQQLTKTEQPETKEKVLETLAFINDTIGAVPISFLANCLDKSLRVAVQTIVYELREAGLVEVEGLNGWEIGVKVTDLAVRKMARKYLSSSSSNAISSNGEVIL